MRPASEGLVIVTGAGTGIGRAIARRLARAGYACFVVGRREDKLEAVSRLISDEGGVVKALPADVTVPDDRRAVFETAAAFGPLVGLVNNAGGAELTPLFAQSHKAWSAAFALNVEAVSHMSGEAIRRMNKTGGSIVNIGSVYGQVALNSTYYKHLTSDENGPLRPIPYAASKGALRMLSRELAIAAAPLRVRVNTVSPGMIEVERHGFTENEREPFARATPLGRMGRPEDIAGAVRFLISSEADFITGAEIVIDGGWTAW